MSRLFRNDPKWEGFAQKLEKAIRSFWPGAVVEVHRDMDGVWLPHIVTVLTHRPYTPSKGPDKGIQSARVLAYAFEHHGTPYNPSVDVQYVTPDDKGVERVVEFIREKMRVPGAAADGAYDNRLGFVRGRAGRRSGSHAGRACRLRAGLASGTCENAEFEAFDKDRLTAFPYRVIGSTGDAVRAFTAIVGSDIDVKEHIMILALDKRNRVIGIADGSSHERSVCAYRAVDGLAAIFRVTHPARVKDVNAVILGHNHPSGDPRPSPHDIRATRDVVNQRGFGQLLVLDHVIVAPGGKAYSFLESDETVLTPKEC